MLDQSHRTLTLVIVFILLLALVIFLLAVHTLVRKRKRDTGKDSSIVRRKKYQELLFSEDTVIDWGVILKEVSTNLASQQDFLWVVQQQPTRRLVVVPDSTMYKDSFSLLYKQAESKNGVKCSRAIIILGALRDNAAVDVFKTGLISSDSDVRLASIRALSHLQTTGATNIILDAMEHNTGNGGNIPWERLTERLNGKWALPALEDRLDYIVSSDML